MRSKKGPTGWMTIKVDLEKAFDRLKWEFIANTLSDANLPPHFTRLTMSCLTSSSMQVLLNGEPCPSFRPHRGIRQGDPLSPYIFVMCMERLSQMILQAVRSGNWQAIRMGRRGVPLSHLLPTTLSFSARLICHKPLLFKVSSMISAEHQAIRLAPLKPESSFPAMFSLIRELLFPANFSMSKRLALANI